uniref:TAP-C domain-containing protein n=1 Tax=Arion vulgaris TaxID=1028688 RepID=A0A0B7A196_9EUPU
MPAMSKQKVRSKLLLQHRLQVLYQAFKMFLILAHLIVLSSAVPFLTPAQIQMVESFTAQSGMNAQFALKCLQENAWDYQRAGQIFTDLNAQGKIPAEAFAKS